MLQVRVKGRGRSSGRLYMKEDSKMLRGWNTAQPITQYRSAANISNEGWTSLRAYVDRYHALNASAVGIVFTTESEISSANKLGVATLGAFPSSGRLKSDIVRDMPSRMCVEGA